MQPTLAQISQFFCLHFLSAGLQACATKPNRKIKFKQKVNDKPSYFNSLCLLPISSIINDKSLGALQVLLRIPQSLYRLAISNEFYETKITVLLLFLLQLLVPSSYTLSLYSIFFLASCDTLSGLHYLYKVIHTIWDKVSILTFLIISTNSFQASYIITKFKGQMPATFGSRYIYQHLYQQISHNV